MRWVLLLGQLWRRRATGGFPSGGSRSLFPGTRVRLRAPLASSQKVWIPAGASGIVVGGDARRVSIELDAPRTVVTVPWAWVEAAPAPAPGPPPAEPPARPGAAAPAD